MDEQQKKSFGSVVRGYAIYTGASILGPLVLFGGVGYCLDKTFGTKPLYLLIAVAVAFAFTNFFLFKKARSLSKEMEEDNNLKDK